MRPAGPRRAGQRVLHRLYGTTALGIVALLVAPPGPVAAAAHPQRLVFSPARQAHQVSPAQPAHPVQPAHQVAPVQPAHQVQHKPRDPRAGAASRQQQRPVGVVLRRVTPASPGPRSTIAISGDLVHQSRTGFNGVTVRLRYSPVPITGRDALRAFADGSAAVPDPTNVAVALPVSPATLNPGERRGWTLKTTARRLGLRSFGVYPVTVDAVDAAGRQLGSQRTVLTYVPKRRAGLPKPVKVAWVWPVIDRPRRSTDAVFLDDRLETDLAAAGRLGGLVTAAGSTNTPVTWAVDPAVIDDARAMTAANGYALNTGQRRPKSPVAERWLRDLKAASNGEDMFATPYADPDLVSLERAGLGRDIATANAEGRKVIQTKGLLSARLRPELTWPVSGYLDRGTLDRLRAAGTRELLLNSAGVPPAAPGAVQQGISGTVATSEGDVRTLATDQTLSRVLGTATARPGTSVVAQQRFLAETAMIGLELPGSARTVVVAPPRRWSPEPALARALLEDTASAPWLKPVSLRQAADARSVRHTLVYPNAVRRYELGSRHLNQVYRLGDGIQKFVSTFEEPGDNILIRAIARTESSALRGRAKRAKKVRDEVEKAVGAEMGKLRLVARKVVSLAGESGPVPVTIGNDLADKTVRVRLQVESENTARLEIGDYTKLTKIGPNQLETIKINMRVFVNGPTNVTFRLETPDGKRLRHSMRVQVRTTAAGKVAVSITGVAIGILFLGIGIRVIRRSRRGEQTEGTE